jgi:hypothetical protein
MALEWNDYRTVAIKTRISRNNDCHDPRTATALLLRKRVDAAPSVGLARGNSLEPSTNAPAEGIPRAIHCRDARIERYKSVALSHAEKASRLRHLKSGKPASPPSSNDRLRNFESLQSVIGEDAIFRCPCRASRRFAGRLSTHQRRQRTS